jgi:hypothetical protein
MGLLDRLSSRLSEGANPPLASRAASDGPVFSTKALPRFLSALTSRDVPVLLDVGPVVGGNVSFFGEHLGCKIVVLDLFADWDRHVREGTIDTFPTFLNGRFTQDAGSIDGVLCWDLLDYLDRPAAAALAVQLARVLRGGGALLGLFSTAKPDTAHYTKYVIVDEVSLRYRPYAAARGRQGALPNRDIQRLFGDLRIADSFLLKNNIREILFRKPA